jgi:hypothetical protein
VPTIYLNDHLAGSTGVLELIGPTARAEAQLDGIEARRRRAALETLVVDR